jgi:hypothetical protein
VELSFQWSEARILTARNYFSRLAVEPKDLDCSWPKFPLLCKGEDLLPCGARQNPGKKLVDEPDTVCVQDITFAIASDFFDLPSQNHFLNAATVNTLRLTGKSKYSTNLIEFYFSTGDV